LSVSQANACSASMRGARRSTVSTTAYSSRYENVSAQAVHEYAERAHTVLVRGEHNVAVEHTRDERVHAQALRGPSGSASRPRHACVWWGE
jgi:hypothetical protein